MGRCGSCRADLLGNCAVEVPEYLEKVTTADGGAPPKSREVVSMIVGIDFRPSDLKASANPDPSWSRGLVTPGVTDGPFLLSGIGHRVR